MINQWIWMDYDGFRRYPFFSQIQWAISETQVSRVTDFNQVGKVPSLTGLPYVCYMFSIAGAFGVATPAQASKICRSKPFGCDWSPQRPCFSSTCCLQSLMVCEEYLRESFPHTTILHGYIIIIIIGSIIIISIIIIYILVSSCATVSHLNTSPGGWHNKP